MADIKLRGWPAAFVPDMSVSDGQTSPTDALAGFRIHSNGYIYTNESGVGYAIRFPWLNFGDNTLFQVKLSETIAPVGGPGGSWTLAGFSWNTWTALTSVIDLELVRTLNADGEAIGQASISIRRISDGEILFLSLINFSATVTV